MAVANLDNQPGVTVARLERSMLTSWPALSTSFDGDWVIRLAKGVTNRSNSVTCLGNEAEDLEARIDRIEAVFERWSLPPTFRISPLASPTLTDALDRRRWRRFDESIVMTADLPLHSEWKTENSFETEIAEAPDHAWLDTCCRIEGTRTTDAATLSRMFECLIPRAGYGRILKDDEIAALAMVVVDHELVGLFEVMTAKKRRRQGFSRALVSDLFRFGEEQGAMKGWLAVAAENEPAVNLYRSLGFSEVYRYHYRSKASSSDQQSR
ncbi:MAG: GNAT family N-acetyltransferase [Geminicoccaceae bacterium]